MKVPHSHHSFSIGKKFFLASLSLLLIPFFGYQHVQEMSEHLRANQEQALLTRAKMVAATLHERPELFNISALSAQPDTNHLYVRSRSSPIILDGYGDEWRHHPERRHTLFTHINETQSKNTAKNNLQAGFWIGSYQDNLYLYFEVKDNQVVYRSYEDQSLNKSDALTLILDRPDGKTETYRITTAAPGRVQARQVQWSEGQFRELEHNTLNINSVWHETATGYNIEVEIPVAAMGRRLGIIISDIDQDSNSPSYATLDEANTKSATLSSIVIPSPELESLLRRLDAPSSRTWVIDRQRRVVALTGRLDASSSEVFHEQDYTSNQSLFSDVKTIFYKLLLPQPTQYLKDDLSTVSKLEGQKITSALQGVALTQWRNTQDKNTNILMASHPVWNQGKVIGAVAIEETSHRTVLLQNRAIEIVINLSLLAFITASIVLLLIAMRLSYRIKKLRNEAEQAIGPDGQIHNTLTYTNASDEIGDLALCFTDVLNRLNQYNQYLEGMSSKLSHELRTPIAIIRSSLDNFDQAENANEASLYVARAREGIERLSTILTRMSEATRLEQTLQQEEYSIFELLPIIKSCVSGYQLAYPGTSIILSNLLSQTAGPVNIKGTPDLIAQLLDKLVNNAIDFSITDTPITIELSHTANEIKLGVFNQGRHLPDNMKDSLFNSMVSIRHQRSKDPHLGLGLYVVRLITQHHRGRVFAYNVEQPKGVRFCVTFPVSRIV
ncbi:hypothetical protein MNBD_GAMMA16-125 [hydrothermal vent metagenome]|uniref:histidine kinase n=1 Tax=hydrothermal vent metagenome TaxID=652676 RepID=A0A3B0Z0S3_9ZZZZ